MLRELNSETTLINPTGFKDKGEEGLEKISEYYESLMCYLESMKNHDSTIILDRFFFSEVVFSSLYKDYYFGDKYLELLNRLENLAKLDGVKVSVVYFKNSDEEEISKRLNREKINFADVKENVYESIKQQEMYSDVLMDARNNVNHILISSIETKNKDVEEVYNSTLSQAYSPAFD